MSARFRYVLWSLAVLTVVAHYAATAMAGPIEDCNTARRGRSRTVHSGC